MKLFQQLSILGLVISSVAVASEHPACENYDQPFYSQSAKALRAIAESCQDEAVSRLYYNRAYFQDLIAEGKVLSNIILHNTESSDYQLTAYRLYIALLEGIAPLYYPDSHQRIMFLNTVYEQRSDVFELRLHGYDKRADILESKILF